MHRTVVIVGAGQTGLAMSAQLTARSIDHVVLERGSVAHSWRTERWDSLRLLTPNWMSGLPGLPYDGDDPDGFETAAQTAARIHRYSRAIDAPVLAGQTVLTVRAHSGARTGGRPDGWSGGGARTGAGGGVHRGAGPAAGRFEVVTEGGRWTCDAVVAATGAAGAPRRPGWAGALPPAVTQITARSYRRPDQVPEGPVLVVGASSSGVQIADELARSGRPVTLAVGEHVRVPRTYRGVDIYRWLHAIGQLDERWDEADDLERVRRLPSFQLIGSPERRDLDLNALQAAGVAVVGRAMALDGHRLLCSGGLAREVAAADLKAHRLLARIDDHIAHPHPQTVLSAGGATGGTSHGMHGLHGKNPADDGPAPAEAVEPLEPVGPPTGLEPTRLGPAATELDVRQLAAVVWATGYHPSLDWIDPAAVDHRGRVRHQGGVADLPGLYLLGLPTLRRRRSTLISGAGPDATDLAAHLHAHLSIRGARTRALAADAPRFTG